MMIMIAQVTNSNNDNGEDDHLNNLFFIILDQEKSQVLSSGKSKDLEIGKSTGTEFLFSFNGQIFIYFDSLTGKFSTRLSRKF